MSFVSIGIALVFVLLSGAVMVKLSGFLVKKSKISWKHSFLFLALLFATMLILGLARGILQFIFPKFEIPTLLHLSIALCLQAYVASEYLGSRALDQDGNEIGATRSGIIGVVLFAIAIILGLFLQALIKDSYGAV